VTTRAGTRSAELLARAERLIPAYTQTLSKNPTQWVRGVAPAYVERAEGAYVWDVDGNRYIDFPMGLGPIILGHGNPAVTAAIEAQLRDGIVFTLPHPIEIDVAQAIVDRVPCAERVRFGKTGSDATSAAIRLARAYTGRDHVLVGGYHGWHDWFIGSTSRNAGVPRAVAELTEEFAFGDLDALDAALERQAGDTAAVILEPGGATVPDPAYLQAVVDRARAAGAVAVFDEIITGFRLAQGGAQERYGVVPDLATYGKALANGMPLSAIAGRADVMDRLVDVFFSGTHGGEALSLAAARATIGELDGAAYERLYALGERLRAGVQKAIADHGVGDWVAIDGEAPRTVVAIREPEGSGPELWAKSVVQQEMLRGGVLFNGSNFICLAHSEDDIDTAIGAYDAAFARLADGLPDGLEAVVEGEPLQPAFRPVK
jgi:glutamate-1-semialdehyde aminotransferase